MSKLRQIIRDEPRQRQGLARGPRIWMRIFWEPILSPTGDRIVGKRQTGARAERFSATHTAAPGSSTMNLLRHLRCG
jgi:hypothetical protein